MLEYLKKIISSKSEESSKRFIAVWTMVLVSIVVIISLHKENVDGIILASTLIGFICVLLGISTYQDVRKTRIEKESKATENE